MQEKVIGFRAKPEHRRKLAEMSAAIGENTSDILRLLVENAQLVEVKTLKPVVNLPTNSKTTLRLSSTGAFAN